MASRPDPRRALLECFRAALAAVDARRCVREQLLADGLTGDWQVLAIGKAAGAMMLGAADRLGPRLERGLVVTLPGGVPPALGRLHTVNVVESAHPMPDERSLAAGAAVERFVTGLPPRAQVLCLVSGGASSLVELLVPGVGLDELCALNARALASGRPIEAINAERRRLSRLKGGGLAALIGARPVRALFVSDVPRDDPAVIGSGLLHPAPPGLAAVPTRIVASVRDACRAAAREAVRLGLEARVSRTRLAGEAGRVGRRLAGTVCRGPTGVLRVWGGESTVVLPEHPGRGGRNQHLALAAAQVLEGRTDVALLAAGTDGVDGASPDAGAIVDGATCERGRDAGYDAGRSLAQADSGVFLEASGDLLHTGPTLTNVGDLVLGLKGEPSQ